MFKIKSMQEHFQSSRMAIKHSKMEIFIDYKRFTVGIKIKNHTQMEEVGYTSEFLFSIY